MDNFLQLNISENITKVLNKLRIITPTKIQTSAIPLIMEKNDVVAESETGSGKTLAYLLPLIEKINFEQAQNQFIILTPTHELAIQVNKVLNSINEQGKIGITSTVIIGNVNIKRQIESLKQKPQFIIGSPGRILELIKLKKISAHTVKSIVIDECDRLLDLNNYDTVKAVIKTTLKERQLLMFSATITEEVIEKGRELMKDPKIIKEQSELKVNNNIDHVFLVCDRRDKILVLRKLMAALKPKKAIAFINKTDEVEILTAKLKYHDLKADGIHGEFVKTERKKVMDEFKSGKINLLVASDIAARGLDIQGVTHVINIDIPEDMRDYLHRSGRTGRVKNKGLCISIVTYNEIEFIKKYEKAFGINIALKELYYGRLIDTTLQNKNFYEKKEHKTSSFKKEKSTEGNKLNYNSRVGYTRNFKEKKNTSYRRDNNNEEYGIKEDDSRVRSNFKKDGFVEKTSLKRDSSEPTSNYQSSNLKRNSEFGHSSKKENSQGNTRYKADNYEGKSKFKKDNSQKNSNRNVTKGDNKKGESFN